MKITKKYVLVGILSLVILITPIMMVGAVEMGASELGDVAAEAGLAAERTLPQMIGLVIKVILSFLGIIAVVIVIIGGFTWMTAGGNEENVKKAKKMIGNGIIGILIVVASYAIANFIVLKLGEIAG